VKLKKWIKTCGIAGFGCLVLLLALTGSTQAKAAEKTGSIQITLKDLSSVGGTSDRNQIEIRAYQVGTMDENDQPVWNTEYGMGEWPDNGTSMVEAAEKLEQKVTGDPKYQGKTDQNGQCLFSNVERGIYLITIPGENAYGKVQPFLVLVPYYEEVNGAMAGPVYEVQAEPKASPNEPNKPDKPKKPHKPHTPSETPDTSETPQNVPNPKTGDDSNILVYAGLAAAMLIMIVVIVTGKYRKKRNVSSDVSFLNKTHSQESEEE